MTQLLLHEPSGSMLPKPACFQGYHSFYDHDAVPYGSFEVFHHEAGEANAQAFIEETGWYWWSCFPGCLPDGEPSGPFPTAEGAYLDAIGE